MIPGGGDTGGDNGVPGPRLRARLVLFVARLPAKASQFGQALRFQDAFVAGAVDDPGGIGVDARRETGTGHQTTPASGGAFHIGQFIGGSAEHVLLLLTGRAPGCAVESGIPLTQVNSQCLHFGVRTPHQQVTVVQLHDTQYHECRGPSIDEPVPPGPTGGGFGALDGQPDEDGTDGGERCQTPEADCLQVIEAQQCQVNADCDSDQCDGPLPAPAAQGGFHLKADKGNQAVSEKAIDRDGDAEEGGPAARLDQVASGTFGTQRQPTTGRGRGGQISRNQHAEQGQTEYRPIRFPLSAPGLLAASSLTFLLLGFLFCHFPGLQFVDWLIRMSHSGREVYQQSCLSRQLDCSRLYWGKIIGWRL